MKSPLLLIVLAAVFVAGCGSSTGESGAPLDSKRPPTPPAPTNGVPPTSAPVTDPGTTK